MKKELGPRGVGPTVAVGEPWAGEAERGADRDPTSPIMAERSSQGRARKASWKR